MERISVLMENAYLTILLVERIGNALKVTGAKKMFANLMVIPAQGIQTVLSINYVIMEIVIGHLRQKYIAIIRCNVLQSMSVLDINALNVDMQADLKDPISEEDHLVHLSLRHVLAPVPLPALHRPPQRDHGGLAQDIRLQHPVEARHHLGQPGQLGRGAAVLALSRLLP